MSFRMWKSYEKEDKNAKDQENSEKIKSLENTINELQLTLSQYANTFNRINHFLDRHEENEVMYSNQITEINDKLQNFFEKEEVHANKLVELESELQTSKEEIKTYRITVEALERRIEELQKEEAETKTSKSKGKIKKKRNITFTNQGQFSQQENFPETIQRAYPQAKSDKMREDNHTLKKTSKNQFGTNSDFKNQYYPNDLKPAQTTVFNPFKYS